MLQRGSIDGNDNSLPNGAVGCEFSGFSGFVGGVPGGGGVAVGCGGVAVGGAQELRPAVRS